MDVDPRDRKPVGDKLKGLTFVVSGVFRNFSRDSIKEAIEQQRWKSVRIHQQQDQLCAGRRRYGAGQTGEGRRA